MSKLAGKSRTRDGSVTENRSFRLQNIWREQGVVNCCRGRQTNVSVNSVRRPQRSQNSSIPSRLQQTHSRTSRPLGSRPRNAAIISRSFLVGLNRIYEPNFITRSGKEDRAVYKIVYSAVAEKPENACISLKKLVGASGFEPPTSWSQTRD